MPASRRFADACLAGLHVIAILLFSILGDSVQGRLQAIETLFCLSGSLFLMMLLARNSRKSKYLLEKFGNDVWKHGWHRLWHSSAIYWCTPMHPTFSKFGPLIYIGESDFPLRRVHEHLIRILRPEGAAQQPFFEVIRRGAVSTNRLRAALCVWLFLPCTLASSEAATRKALEREYILALGVLNPPCVYALPELHETCKDRRGDHHRIFGTARPLKRLRQGHQTQPKVSQLPRLDARKAGLRTVAAAIAGHRFQGHKKAALSVWNLSPSSWVYVVLRATDHEEGWRRKRALVILKRVQKVRRDLPMPIAVVQCCMVWTGSFETRLLVTNTVRTMLRTWNSLGIWTPVLRHAVLKFHWKATPTLAESLCTASALPHFLSVSAPPPRCAQLFGCDERWPGIVIDGERHIAATHHTVPWPSNLEHSKTVAATLNLPPKRTCIVAQLRSTLRRLRQRCKVRDDCCSVESLVSEASGPLWEAVLKNSRDCPVGWRDVYAARKFLAGLFIQHFDHNPSMLGIFCWKLVIKHCRKALNFGTDQSTDFRWQPCASHDDVLQRMCSVPGLSHHLQPSAVTSLSRRAWAVAGPAILPKWKAPGVKWRLLINKRFTPCNSLHSLVCRAIDVLMNALPRQSWCDAHSIDEIVSQTLIFNAELRSRYVQGGFHAYVAAADMINCFHHLPVDQILSTWDDLAAYWRSKGVSCVSVSRHSNNGGAKLGRYDMPGFFVISLEDVRACLKHFSETNYVALPGWLGRELRGAPMGDALSGAVLRLFKWGRLRACSFSEQQDTANLHGTCIKLVRLGASNVMVLDISFRDDIRLFCAWSTRSMLRRETVANWCSTRFQQRFCVGSMRLEDSDKETFVGLRTRWNSQGLQVFPSFPCPWAAIHYRITELPCIKQWVAWTPRAQKSAVVRGMLCRAWYFSNNGDGRRQAIYESFLTLIGRAMFPKSFVASIALKWAKGWLPRNSIHPPSSNLHDVEYALSRV